MSAQYSSKHGIVPRPQAELYMAFTDMRTFLAMLPEDKKEGVTADFDTITATVQGFTIGVKVTRREPYNYIELQDNGAPFHFMVSLHFDPADDPGKTDFHIDLLADLNVMMKMMIGKRLQEALDKVVDGLCGNIA
ncbi:MAG: hypothetical protein IJQ22_09040 [Bacteroidales bacterium]|jgi:hypothetical protein|nr:hypothetical protein [Bacteroidales bacterium]